MIAKADGLYRVSELGDEGPRLAGAGKSLKLAPVMTASVPQLPINSFIRSKPATFFTTRPPPLPLRPSPVTKRMPMQ